MREPHLLAVEHGPGDFAPLIAAAGRAGLRVGWLDLRRPDPFPEDLAAAAESGTLRALAIGEGWSVAVKKLKGAPVLRDLLREHFRGSALVLVRGAEQGTVTLAPAPPRLEPEGPASDRWRLTPPGMAVRVYSTEELIAELRRPHPWPLPPPAPESTASPGGSPGSTS